MAFPGRKVSSNFQLRLFKTVLRIFIPKSWVISLKFPGYGYATSASTLSPENIIFFFYISYKKSLDILQPGLPGLIIHI